MRIAISGTHLAGKTTLSEALAEALRGYELVPEPYYLLDDFAAMPSIEDFESQLERSIQLLNDSAPDTIFDRCPLDFLGYIAAHDDAEAFDTRAWLPRVRNCMPLLDVIAFVPIEVPDRVDVPREQLRFRARVDAELRDIVLDDRYGFDLNAIEVRGTTEQRLRQLLHGRQQRFEP